jgi:flagellar hook-associated protein 3 FlgL
MRINGGGSELARLQMLQRQAVEVRNKLDVAGKEMTTTEKASRYEATGGNLTRLFSLERSLDRNAVYAEPISLTETRLDVMQTALGTILSPVEDLSVDLTAAVSLGDRAAALTHAASARAAFAGTVSALNTQVAGQSLFAGTATDRPALAGADALLADLDALAQGSATAADAIDAIDAYFTRPSGGFFAGGYTGSDADLTSVDIGEGTRLDYGIRADKDELVAVLRAQAMAAVVAGGAFDGDDGAQMAMLDAAAASMLEAKEGLLDIRSDLGVRQERLETAKAQRTSERETLDLARSEIVATDPLEAASTYQTLEVQLESIYTVTARIANLRFLNFMS